MHRRLGSLLLPAKCHDTSADSTSNTSDITTDNFTHRVAKSPSESELHLRRQITVRSQRDNHPRRGGYYKPASAKHIFVPRRQSSLLQDTNNPNATDTDESSNHDDTCTNVTTYTNDTCTNVTAWTDADLFRVQ